MWFCCFISFHAISVQFCLSEHAFRWRSNGHVESAHGPRYFDVVRWATGDQLCKAIHQWHSRVRNDRSRSSDVNQQCRVLGCWLPGQVWSPGGSCSSRTVWNDARRHFPITRSARRSVIVYVLYSVQNLFHHLAVITGVIVLSCVAVICLL